MANWKYMSNEMGDLIYTCDECGYTTGVSYTEPELPLICPNCLALMKNGGKLDG